MEPVAAALARLSKAQAKCAKELEALSESHADSPAWASAGIAAVARLCHDPASAAAAAATLGHLSAVGESNDDLIREGGAIPSLVAVLTGGIESFAATQAAAALANLTCNKVSRAAIIEAGAIPPLAALLSGGAESQTASEAAGALRNLARDDEGQAAITEAGAVPPLVALLSGGPESEAAREAVGALTCLTCSNVAIRAAIIEAGAIPPLVALLSGGPDSEAAADAARTLANLAFSIEAIRAAIIEAGAIPPLVALLSGGPESEAAGGAAGALRNLACYDEAIRAAIIEAGAVPPLVALLSGGPESEAARRAAAALRNLACGTNTTAVLEEVARTQTDCSSWDRLQEVLRDCASARLHAAEEEGTDVAALERAITLATAVQVDAAALEHAQGRLREINGDAERQERRESFGLGSLELPDEFVCPITMEKMRGAAAALAARIARAPPHRCHAPPACAYADPVVASDGHSYERSAILSVLRDGNGLSPLTREPLQPNVLIQNRNLKRRMQEHEEDVLRIAATVFAIASDGAQQPGPAAGGGGSSSEPAPKRSRRAR